MMPVHTSSKFSRGNVTIGADASITAQSQLSNFSSINLSVNSTGNTVEPLLMTYDGFEFIRIGTFVHMTGMTITYINTAGSSISVRDGANNTFVLRIDSATGLTAASFGLSVGQTITATGPLGYYDFNFVQSEDYVYLQSNFQLMITTAADITIE